VILLDYGANPPPADTAGTGLPQVFGTDDPVLLIVALVILGVAALRIARRSA
jgi:hypothetical protein